MPNRILVVDDEKNIVKGLKFSLEQDGMTVDAAYDGEEALRLVRENEYDMVLLDVMLPKLTGIEVCQQIREFSVIPILMVTAKSEDMDKILGLEYGADDYLIKPFNILELKARIKAILRRTAKKAVSSASDKRNRRTRLRDLEIDPGDRRVFLKNAEINLTAREFDLLDLFMDNRGKVYSREDLLNMVWGKDYPGDARTVDVHVRRLREKIEDNPSDPKYLFTKWGVGYYFE